MPNTILILPAPVLISLTHSRKAIDFISYVYYLPTTHMGPFFMGMVLGHLLKEGYAPRFGKLTLLLGNTISFGFLLAAVFGCYPFRAGWPVDYLWIAIYGGFHRIIWTLGVSFCEKIVVASLLIPCGFAEI